MTSRRRTLGLLLGALTLAVGTPGYLAVADPELRGYLLHPAIFIVQAAPYLVAGMFWLPFRTKPATTVAQWVAGALLLAACLLYVPMLTGFVPMGGDMVGLAFVAITVATISAITVVTVVAWGLLYVRRRSESSD